MRIPLNTANFRLKLDAPIANVSKTKFCKTLLRVPITSFILKKDPRGKEPRREHGYVDCTPDHKFLTTLGYVKAEDLKVGDVLVQSFVNAEPYEIAYNDYVYDIEVPGYENFAVLYSETNYTIVHNCRSVHAECNAIMNAGRDKCIGATLYLCGIEASTGEIIKNADCCTMCKRLIINAGIDKVVIRDPEPPGGYRTIPVSNWVKADDSQPEHNNGY